MQKRFEYDIIRNIPLSEDHSRYPGDVIRNDRMIFYLGKSYGFRKQIKDIVCEKTVEKIHFVSFEHECIMSIYNHDGCDIVFFAEEKFKEFYGILEPHFNKFALDIMRQRLYNLS